MTAVTREENASTWISREENVHGMLLVRLDGEAFLRPLGVRVTAPLNPAEDIWLVLSARQQASILHSVPVVSGAVNVWIEVEMVGLPIATQGWKKFIPIKATARLLERTILVDIWQPGQVEQVTF